MQDVNEDFYPHTCLWGLCHVPHCPGNDDSYRFINRWHGHIYEVVDFSSDEVYYPLGLWLTLDDALKALANAKRPSDLASEGEHDGYYRVEIRRRKTGWDDHGKCIYCITFHERYDEERDEYVWDRTDTFGNCIGKDW